MRIHCVQMDIEWEAKPANFFCAQKLLQAARPEAGSLVLLPEMFATGFSMNVAGIAEAEGGATEQFLVALARDLKCTMIGGVVRLGPDGMGRNRALAIGPNGEKLADYAKLHPFSFGEESQHYRGGAGITPFAWQGATVLPTICYDLRFPELFRQGVRAGAEIMTVIAEWPAARDHHWLMLLTARAIENQCYVAGCNRVGRDARNEYSGRSVIIDPRGRVIADAGAAEMVLGAEIDLAALRFYRREFPALSDIRRDL